MKTETKTQLKKAILITIFFIACVLLLTYGKTN